MQAAAAGFARLEGKARGYCAVAARVLGNHFCKQHSFALRLKEDDGVERVENASNPIGRMGVPVDTATFASLLRCCGSAKALWDGKRAHAHIIRA
eukprot:c30866_g1_i1 orf=45-329(+)